MMGYASSLLCVYYCISTFVAVYIYIWLCVCAYSAPHNVPLCHDVSVCSSMSGIVLMDGFQELFTRSDVRNETNSSATSTCSTGEGADSDFLLVRFVDCYMHA